jgi:hypothetical protein
VLRYVLVVLVLAIPLPFAILAYGIRDFLVGAVSTPILWQVHVAFSLFLFATVLLAYPILCRPSWSGGAFGFWALASSGAHAATVADFRSVAILSPLTPQLG